MSSVSLINLNKSYGKTAVVRDVNLTLNEGEFIVLLGPSGCGKTTILRLLAGFVDPTVGTIHIGGKDVTHIPPRNRGIGMVFQNYALFPNMTIGENIGFGMRQRKADKQTIQRRVKEMLELIQLEGREHDSITQLSGGQQQRVALARAIAPSPHLLLMDEALGALDQKLREELQIELLRIQRELKITTILVTHDQKEAMVLADRIVIMANGEIQQVGTPEELYSAPANAFVADFIGHNNLLRGTLTQANGEPAVDLGGDIVMPVKPGIRANAGDAIELSIRPENLVLHHEKPAGMQTIPAEVTEVLFLGNVTHYFVRTPWDKTLLVESTRNMQPHRIGDEVNVSWEPLHAMAFCGNTGGLAQ